MRVLVSTKAILLKVVVIDLRAGDPTQRYKGRCWGCEGIWFHQQLQPLPVSCSWHMGEKEVKKRA